MDSGFFCRDSERSRRRPEEVDRPRPGAAAHDAARPPCAQSSSGPVQPCAAAVEAGDSFLHACAAPLLHACAAPFPALAAWSPQDHPQPHEDDAE